MTENHYVLSNCGVRMPRIVYGTAWKKARTAALVEQAIGHGFRGIDTACQPRHYDEAGVGGGLAACLKSGLDRADIYLQTKFTALSGQDPRRIPYDPKASLPEQVAQSFLASLQNLRTPYVDCLVLHSPLADEDQSMQVWRAMEAIVRSGGARQLGISNCYNLQQLELLHELAEIKPAVVQNRFHADTGYDREIRAYCRQHGMFYQSFWTLTANPDLLARQVVTGLSAKYGRSPAQILFRYLTQVDVIPLTGTTSPDHMREDLAIFEFELRDDECEEIGRCLN